MRINLALSDEALGDAAVAGGDVPAPGGRGAPASRCWPRVAASSRPRTPSRTEPDPEPEPTPAAAVVQAREVDDRIGDKLRESAATSADRASTPEQQARAQQLAARNDRGQRQRDRKEQERQDRDAQPGGTGEGDGTPLTYEW